MYGKPAVEAGGPWMGLRLDSKKNDDAYQAVVYNKGGYILHMLRMMMWTQKDGDKPFRDMLQEFVKVHLNRNATTEGFQVVAEKYMTPQMDLDGDHKLDWFFTQWGYGATVPRFKFEPEVTPAAEGRWLLKATLTQSEVDVNFASLVPLYAEFETGLVRLGMIRLIGNTTVDKIQLMLPRKPKRVLINAWYDVLEL